MSYDHAMLSIMDSSGDDRDNYAPIMRRHRCIIFLRLRTTVYTRVSMDFQFVGFETV